MNPGALASVDLGVTLDRVAGGVDFADYLGCLGRSDRPVSCAGSEGPASLVTCWPALSAGTRHRMVSSVRHPQGSRLAVSQIFCRPHWFVCERLAGRTLEGPCRTNGDWCATSSVSASPLWRRLAGFRRCVAGRQAHRRRDCL
jgi:hypothetical protein